MDQSESNSLIQLNALEKAYGDNVVLKGIDLSIARGEFLVLVGPSGCGKSTLLRCIAGLEEISKGDLIIEGKRSNDVHPRDRDLAMVFQSYALYPHLTVRDNVAFSLTVRKMDKAQIDRRVNEAAKRLGLESLLNRLPKQLSGGQRQRVAVGRAIVREPRAFLFDEPLSNLDAELRGQMRVELKKLHRDIGSTMIYVTHDQVEAMTLADRIVVLKDGYIQQVGTPDELYLSPANRFVARFIGSPPMNFFEGEYDLGKQAVVGDGFSFPIPIERYNPENLSGGITVGLRPISMINPEGECEFTAEIGIIEPVGWDAHVHLEISGVSAMAQINAKAALEYKTGETETFRANSSDLHLFDAETGEVL